MSNLDAFLTTIAVSEGTQGLGDRGYNCLVGGNLFIGYFDHPREKVWLEKLGIFSTAAGRYQILARIFDFYQRELRLPDFSPASQDAIAIKLIRECDALEDINAGRFDTAAHKVRSRWASFPGAGYGQHEQKIERLRAAFTAAGGVIA